ncbi:hypothetical protein J6590_087547 [Homalodisca vitripennis]|nr:hypothetical protein J6590_087547 [Homalodisca vitripennis]
MHGVQKMNVDRKGQNVFCTLVTFVTSVMAESLCQHGDNLHSEILKSPALCAWCAEDECRQKGTECILHSCHKMNVDRKGQNVFCTLVTFVTSVMAESLCQHGDNLHSEILKSPALCL